MRTIKFRAKAMFNGTIGSDMWVYSESIQNHNGILRLGGVTCQSETLGQFIGICDKNGIEICEDDVIKYTGRRNEMGEYQIIYATTSFIGFNDNIDELNFSHDYERNDIVIIGNIHDDKHLIKTK